jgi:hypothetical protein
LSGWLEQAGRQGQSNLPASAADIPSGVTVTVKKKEGK